MTLARHKFHTNRLLNGLGFNVPQAFYFSKSEELDGLKNLHYPLIVKPNHESDSLGISENSIVENSNELTEVGTELIREFQQGVIVERFIPGEEWKVALIGNGSSTKVAGASGVMRNGKKIINSLQTRNDIINHTLDYYVPKQSKKLEKVMEIALEIHCLLELRDYSRIDFRLDEKGEIFCMEVSTHPQLEVDSSFIHASIPSLNSYGEIIEAILNSALSRTLSQSLQN